MAVGRPINLESNGNEKAMNRPPFERLQPFLWSFVSSPVNNATQHAPIIKMFKHLNGEEWPCGMVDRKSNIYYCWTRTYLNRRIRSLQVEHWLPCVACLENLFSMFQNYSLFVVGKFAMNWQGVGAVRKPCDSQPHGGPSKRMYSQGTRQLPFVGGAKFVTRVIATVCSKGTQNG